MKFDLSDIDPRSIVTSAILYLYDASGGNNTYEVDILEVTSGWDEMNVTWDTQPGFDTTPIGSFGLTKTTCTRATYLNLLTVQAWVSMPALNNGVMIYPPSGNGDVVFASREAGDAQAPQLWLQVQ